MIVQALHHLQEECGGYLPKDRMEDLAAELNVPMYRLQEVASFFNHYRFEPPARVHVRVCQDLACHMAGAEHLIHEQLKELVDKYGPDVLDVEPASCLGQCDCTVATMINHHPYVGMDASKIQKVVEEIIHDTHKVPKPDRTMPDWNIDPYKKQESYEIIQQLVQSDDIEAEGERILKMLEEASLVGKGGPGARTAKKWRTVMKEGKNRPTKYVVCNADESEPGTFKDRELLLRAPHLVIEGIMVAGMIVGAEKGYIYCRHEFPDQIDACNEAIARAKANKLCGKNICGTKYNMDVEVFVSPGNYICGEQTALIEAMEDKRAQPRQRPPDLEIQGLHGCPTLVNNVETLGWVPSIAKNGPDWYLGLGANGCTGMRFTSISGDVNNPGVYEVPLGSTVGELLKIVGGMKPGVKFQAFASSGPSGGFLPRKLPKETLPPAFVEKHMESGQTHYDVMNLTLDNNYLRYELKGALMMGAAHVFIGDNTDLLHLARSCTEFFRNESCGKCVPCRVGSEKMVKLAQVMARKRSRISWRAFEDLRDAMVSASICGLGQVASNPLQSIRVYFPEMVGLGPDGQPLEKKPSPKPAKSK